MGYTALTCASDLGEIDMVKVLLEAGADVKAINRHVCPPNFCSEHNKGFRNKIFTNIFMHSRIDLSEAFMFSLPAFLLLFFF